MKKLQILILFIVAMIVTSCQKDFLDEKPLDFLSSENAYTSYDDFNDERDSPFDYLFSTDIVYDGQPHTNRHSNMAAAFDPTSRIPRNHWELLYKIISEANTVMSRMPKSEMTEEQKTEIEAQARFFRALSYRTLVYLFGGVPLTLEEITTPKVDFVRASKEEVLAQIIIDLNFAADNLPGITDVQDGKLNNLAAQHLLSEVYLAAGEYQNAVNAASIVIDDPATALMQNRFGSRATETPGDVYWDLFRRGNQNRRMIPEVLLL